ncbi:hypothetical protein [Pontibaca salina]|uniref:DUF1214 domain-containing protein n=1 Tax=Pontibaca salina TaxID=2795731 RepID=A0A934HPH4_9RHOB|nr:hypothetical protein [Pontibaca salina]MBI6630811.1 hypothetical protein [Pontibaca salina]
MLRKTYATLLFVLATSVAAQTPTPEEIAALVDQRVSALNPYGELLNDPDPERSLAAMQIMLESGNAELTRMALEFGLLSPNPVVRRAAVEAHLKSGPTLTLKFEGGDDPDPNFTSTVVGYYSGSTEPGNQGYWKIKVGEYSADDGCYLHVNARSGCFVTVNSDGVYFTHDQYKMLAARTDVTDEGLLKGFAKIYKVAEPVPLTVQLID